MPPDPRRSIPAVDRLLTTDPFRDLLDEHPRSRVVGALRRELDGVRSHLARREEGEAGGGAVRGREAGVPETGASKLAGAVRRRLLRQDRPSLRRVINATGVVLHTNLGRAPLAPEAFRAVERVGRGYANLEFDLEEGARGSRYVHCAALVAELVGAEDALVVNNNAAATALAVDTLARERAVVVSRGELVEIGGGFRIPEVLERSGARLREVGTTNRTRLDDYERAARAGDVALLLKVHRSNFALHGFTEEVSVSDLAALASRLGLPLLHDVGSGLLAEPVAVGLPDEPRPADSLAAGAHLVAFSGDKLLGGPQAGILAGRRDRIAALRRNPLCRAFRVDKATLAALEATLALYRDPERAVERIPVLRMLAAPPEELRTRAERLRNRLGREGIEAEVTETESAVGGGSVPGWAKASWALALGGPGGAEARLGARLRDGDPPVVGRLREGRLLLDLRTVGPDEEDDLVRRIGEEAGAA